MTDIKKSKEIQKDNSGFETSVLPIKYVDLIEDIFHAVLALALLAIGIGAFFYSIERLITTAPFFPNGMIQGVNDTWNEYQKFCKAVQKLATSKDWKAAKKALHAEHQQFIADGGVPLKFEQESSRSLE